MAIEFHKLTIKRVTKETKDSVTLHFDVPNVVKEKYVYKPGQFLTIKAPIESGDNRRAYSISSSPFTTEDLAVTVKKVDNGLVSAFLTENVKEGDVLDVLPPLGRFTIEMKPDNCRNYVFVAGGSGITPLYSLIKSALIKEPMSKAILFDSNRNKSAIIFYDKLEELKAKFPDRLQIIHSTTEFNDDWTGYRGRLSSDVFQTILIEKLGSNAKNAECFLCGPFGLMQQAENAFAALGVPKEKVHRELFTAPISEEAEDVKVADESDIESKTRTVKIKIYGEEATFDVQPGENILAAAHRFGVDAPFSCQIGACSTCRAKVVTGKVILDEREALTDDEIEEGYVLSCVTRPASDDVFVNFDL